MTAKILIVDDIEENILTLKVVLKGLPIEIITATSGNDALRETLTHDFALVLLDVQMPNMSGYEVAELMAGNEHTANTPIIFVTANSIEKENIIRGYSVGAVDYLTKPVNSAILRTKVRIFTDLYNQKYHLEELNQNLLTAQNLAEKALQTKSIFLANMSHEIRTPMNGVIGMIELLLNTELTEKQKKYSETAYTCSQSLISLINDVLDCTKIESGCLELDYSNFSIYNLVAGIIDMFEGSAKKNDVTMGLKTDILSNEEFVGDQHRIRQIISNLIGNAIKFSRKGTIAVHVSVKEQEDKSSLSVEVIDTGIGIPKERQEAIFDTFTQADSSTTKTYGGSGLGLSICKDLIELMGGNIGVESEEGKGSKFWFNIPLKRSTQPELKDSQNNNVLLVGDNEINLSVFTEHLEQNKISYIVLSNTEGVLNKLESDDVYSTLMIEDSVDIEDKVVLAKTIREKYPNIELVLVTLDTQKKENWEFYSSIGFSRQLSLPVYRNDLKRLLG